MSKDLSVLKTKLGVARPVALRTPDGKRDLLIFHATGTGRPLNHEEALQRRTPSFRGIHLASEGKFTGRPPFHAVFGLVGGAGRIVVYDRFGMAVRWEGAKPAYRRRGLRFLADPKDVLRMLWREPADLLGFPGAYLCPACGTSLATAPPPSDFMRIPLCERCLVRGGKERDWVGTWQCFKCGDRVKDEELQCPFCGRLARERQSTEPQPKT